MTDGESCYSADELSKSEDGLSVNRSIPDLVVESPNFADTYNAWHEMLEAENRGVAGRLADLERKVLEQADELMCLKATLAEALRRVSQLEGTKIHHHQASAVSSPIRMNGNVKDVVRLRQQQHQQQQHHLPSGYSTPKNLEVHNNRRSFVGNSALPQRRAVHYQSTGSLHSDSQSSSSVSPAPSPSPRATPQPSTANSRKISTNSPSPVAAATGAGNLHKRWSSTGDFYQNNAIAGAGGMQSKFSTKSFLNLYTKANSFPSGSYKHGTKDAAFNDEEKTLKMFLRGRPIVLYAPTELGDNYEITKVSTAPSQKLKLDWVYGYRGRDCRSNLYFLPTGEMVYFVAAVVVLYNVEEQSQRHYLGHTDDVKSLAIHPNKMLVATGQCAGADRRGDARPHIRVWNSVSLSTQAVIGMNDFDLSVCCLSFSKADGGSLLLAVDEAPDHNISIWDWQKGEHGYKITETKCSVDTIVSAEFHPLDRNIVVTCGKSHIAFWTLDTGGTLYKRMGIFDSRDKPKYVTCVAFLQSGETITGDSNGNLQVWGRGTNTIWKFIKNVHEGAIFSICVLKDGSIVTGGGKDARLVLFDSNLQKVDETQIEGHFGGIRVVSEGCGSQLIIGTTRNCILNGTVELGFQPIILGHTDELVALASHPSIQQFATAGYDKVLQLWDSLSHSILWSKDIGEQAQSLAYSIDGTCVVVGCTSGRWMIFDTQSRELLEHHTDGAEPIQVIQCSPDGTMVALGSRDNNIYIYQISEDGHKYSRVGRCMGHSSFITHLDWSTDNQTIRSSSGDYELLYWNAATCRQIPQTGVMRDVDWATNNCTITFTTIGIWPENADGTDVNFCDRSHDKRLLAAADDFGKVKLYSYPAAQPKCLCHTYSGHSSHVMAVNFLHDDTRLVSIGGKDTSVLQWTVA